MTYVCPVKLSEAQPSLEVWHTARDGERKQIVTVGDQFDWWDGSRWEVVGFTGSRTYGPAGLGGTPIVRCRQLSGSPQTKWLEPDGTVEWCGDSVAGGIHATAGRCALEAG